MLVEASELYHRWVSKYIASLKASKLQMEPKRVQFIQKLNIIAMHWITISAIDLPLFTIRVYEGNHANYHRMYRSLLQISCNPTKSLLRFNTYISMYTNSLIPMIVVYFQLPLLLHYALIKTLPQCSFMY